MDASKPETKERRNPAPYEVYRHFKGNSYQILTLAKDSSDGHEVVVYQALYEPYEVYTRKLSEFMSEVDKWKYPKAKQKYRFEKISKDRWHEQEAEDTASITAAGTTVRAADQAKTGSSAEAGNADASAGSKTGAESEKAAASVSTGTVEKPNTDTTGMEKPAAAAESAVSPAQDASSGAAAVSNPQAANDAAADGEGNLDPAVLEFLDARTNEERLNVLASVKHRITDEMLNTMAICADIELNPGPVEERYRSLKNCLLTKEKFERLRLR